MHVAFGTKMPPLLRHSIPGRVIGRHKWKVSDVYLFKQRDSCLFRSLDRLCMLCYTLQGATCRYGIACAKQVP